MNTRQVAFSLKKELNAVNWKLLVFLVLMMDVKLLVKLAAIIIVFITQPIILSRFNFKKERLPLFYIIMVFIVLADCLLYQNLSTRYLVIAFTAIAFWMASIAAVHYIKLFVDNTSLEKLHQTLRLFFILNIAWSGINLLSILWEIGWRNPFLYQGQYQKYFINTGDYIKGISFDTSTTNAIINCFGIVYFLFRKKYLLLLACMATLLLTASNFSILVLLLAFAGIFALNSTREQKSIMVVCAAMLVIFFIKCSPQNENYVSDTISKFFLKTKKIIPAGKEIPIRERPDSLLTTETRKEKIATLYLDSLEREHARKDFIAGKPFTAARFEKPAIPKDSIHTASFQWKRDTTVFQHQLLAYIEKNAIDPFSRYDKRAPGKILAFQESLNFLENQPQKILAGDGAGNFSSKLAFRATGLKIAGAFPASLAWCNADFLHNHLSLYAFFFTKHADSHSIIHSPASVYDQLLTEYGLLGLIAFLAFYAWFFLTRINKRSYGAPLLLMMLAFFAVDYWFEQLSVVILFELIMFVNIKEHEPAFAYD
jgi:hypothetical protein